MNIGRQMRREARAAMAALVRQSAKQLQNEQKKKQQEKEKTPTPNPVKKVLLNRKLNRKEQEQKRLKNIQSVIEQLKKRS